MGGGCVMSELDSISVSTCSRCGASYVDGTSHTCDIYQDIRHVESLTKRIKELEAKLRRIQEIIRDEGQ